MPRRSILLFAGACLAIAAAVIVTTLVLVNRPAADAPRAGAVISSGRADIGGPFQLVDQNGRAVDQTLLDGKWSLVFFGFTWCPDFCPTTLQALEATKQRLGDQAKDLQIVFITVDPNRDTPQAMKDYLSTDGFPEGVIGLTGTPAQVKAAADAYKAFYEQVGTGEDYTVNHSLTVYLMGPDGQFRTAIAGELGPQRSAEVIGRAMARG